MQSIRRNSRIAVVLQSAVVLFIGAVILNRAVAQPTDLYDFTGGPADARAGSVTGTAPGSVPWTFTVIGTLPEGSSPWACPQALSTPKLA
jgi:hypothetical protein